MDFPEIKWRPKDDEEYNAIKSVDCMKFLDFMKDKDLANLSLCNTILCLNKAVYEFNVYVGASENGETNIDSDVLEELSNAFRRK